MHQIELLHTDCMEYMAGLPDKAFDLAIVDPPYGAGMSISMPRSKQVAAAWNTAPGAEYFAELRRVSENQVVWGGNYFDLPPSRCMLVWDKCFGVDNLSGVELAWTSFDKVAALFRHANHGFMRDADDTGHPTPKPVALYRWLLKNYAKPGQRILDTHLGSGSIAIACDLEGFALVGCEIDADYIKAARHRLAVHQSAPRLFEATPAGLPQQLSLGDDVLSDGT